MRLYHGTSRKAKKKIQEEGLKAIHALDENNITRNAGIDPGNKPVVYTARKRKIALGHTSPHLIKGDGAGLVRMSIPYDEYKKMKRSYVKPGMSVPKSKVREYLRTKTPEINSSNDMVNWGINIKAARSSNISSARSTHLGYNNEPRRFKKSMWLNNPESQKLYDHGNGKNLTGKHKETMKFVRETINKNK